MSKELFLEQKYIVFIYILELKKRGHNKHDGMTIQSILINGHGYSVRKLTGIKNCFLNACMPFIHDDNTRDENYNCKKSYKLTGKTIPCKMHLVC